MVINSDYYGGGSSDDPTTALRKKQATQSALVDQQNTVSPAAPTAPSAPVQPQSTPAATSNEAVPPHGPMNPDGSVANPPTVPVPAWDPTVFRPGYDYATASGQNITAANTNEAFQKYLGHPFTPGVEGNPWANDPQVGRNVYNSEEAFNYRAHPTSTTVAPPGGGPPPTAPPGGSQLPPKAPQTPAEWLAAIGQFKSLYQPGQLPGAYAPSQLMSSDAQNAQQMQFGLLQQVLSHPDAYSEQNIRQMQEAQKEQALASQQSEMQKMTDRYAGLGRTGSGQLDMNQRRLSDNTTGQLLQSNRDIGLQAANANFNSRLSTLGSANDLISSSVGNQQAQAGENYKGQQSALTRALAQEGLNKDQSTLALQAALASGGLSLDQYKAILAAYTTLGVSNSNAVNNNSTTVSAPV